MLTLLTWRRTVANTVSTQGSYQELLLSGFSVIVGGMPSIASVTEKVVPWMAALYIGMALIVIGSNLDQVGPAFSALLQAFTGEGVGSCGFIAPFNPRSKTSNILNEAGSSAATLYQPK